MKRIAILGSTGSIGHSTLNVVEAHPERFSVVSLAAGSNVEAAFEQAKRWRPRVFSMRNAENAEKLRKRLNSAEVEGVEVVEGSAGSVAVATHPAADFVVSAMVGVTGLEATYEAVRAGKRVGLANKEVLVAGGRLVMEAVRQHQAELLPVDSEHNGAHQCLRAGNRQHVTKLILTA